MPYEIVRRFEKEIAEYSGSRYAIAVESCSAAIFLSCLYVGIEGREVTIPARTYPSVPAGIIHAGGQVKFNTEKWSGVYRLQPFLIYDGALRFRPQMYEGGLHCLSFHGKKLIPIGRGGMILTNDGQAAEWLRCARFDGREECDLSRQQEIKILGWNMYMTPEQAARGLQIFSLMRHRTLADLNVAEQGYPDLSTSPIFKTGKK